MNGIIEWFGWDWILLIINVALTLIAWRAARRSEKYFNKSRNLTIYAQTNKALSEISNMQELMTEVIRISNPKNRKGVNYIRKISELGVSLDASYNLVLKYLPHSYYEDFTNLKPDGAHKVDLQKYINSLIDGSAVSDDGLDTDEHTKYKKTLSKMQEFLKKKISETEELLK